MSKKIAGQAKRGRFERAVATETFPAETPAIFSNDGFYWHCVREKSDSSIKAFVFDTVVREPREKPKYTRPYKYRIRKSSLEFRRLSLLHPHAQWEIAQFYDEYQGHICHFCTRSAFSVRAPERVANVVYLPGTAIQSQANKLSSESSADPVDSPEYTYFGYRGYDRLYRFFNSKRLVDLEARFGVLWKMDVAKCFDSIYTHSISWATRGKEFSKSINDTKSFGDDFDLVVRSANNNETNGIPIGPEASRIFAEVIFQDIDCAVDAHLSPELKSGVDYEVVRYVDDIFIFARDDESARIVHDKFVENLANFNLHSNPSKISTLARPFFTKKSKVIRDVNLCINAFVDGFLVESDDRELLIPKKIHRQDRHLRSFVDAVKSTCTQNEVTYDEVTPYVVSALLQRTKKLVKAKSSTVRPLRDEYFRGVVALLDASFFFYTVAPAVSASYHLCEGIVLLSRFAARQLAPDLASVRQLIHERCLRLFEGDWAKLRTTVSDFVFLEAINIALSTCSNGFDFVLPSQKLRSIFVEKDKLDYFQLISMLYYCKDAAPYEDLKLEAIIAIDERLRDLKGVLHDAQTAHLFLDALSCPFIPIRRRAKWLGRLYKLKAVQPPPRAEILAYLAAAPKEPWFVDWLEEDLLRSLSKKRLKQVYA